MKRKERELKLAKPPNKIFLAITLFLSAISLFTPYYNLLDITPDFLPLLLLALLAGKYSEFAPYFAEVRSGLIKLAAVSFAKYPALLIMWSNVGTGYDILPLFSIVFAAFELIVLIPLIRDTFAALFYVGERESCNATIKSFRIFMLKISPETVKNLLYFFAVFRSVFSLLPEMLLLTTVSEKLTKILRTLYLPSVFLSLLLVSLVGLLALILSLVYTISIIREGKLSSSIYAMAGAERIERVRCERDTRKVLFVMSALILSSFLLFDVAFSDINYGVNILPHVIYGIFITILGSMLATREGAKVMMLISGAFYSLASLASHHLAIRFYSEYELLDLVEKEGARAAYIPYEIAAALELLTFAVAMTVFARIFISAVTANTGAVTDDPLSKQTKKWRASLTVRGYIFAYFPLLILALKTTYVYITNNVIVEPNAKLNPIITTELPWWPFMVIGVGIVYVFYAYLYLTEVKEEIKLKYSDEKETFE